MPRESSVVDRIVRRIRASGGQVMKTHGSAMSSGQPDLIACVRGRFIALECKQPGNHPTPQQEVRLAEWARAGALAFWADDPDVAMKRIEEYLSE